MSRDDQRQTFILTGPRAVERLSGFLLRREWGRAIEVIVQPVTDRRTEQQNKRYHAIVREIADQVLLDGKRYHPDVWKEQFKRWFIGSNEETLPSGEVITSGISTAKLSRAAFSDYMLEIESWATENGVRFSEPATRYLSEWRAESQRAASARRFT